MFDAAVDAAKGGAAATQVAAITAKVYDSSELQKIKADKTAKLKELQAETDEDKAFELNTELFNLKQAERAEVAKLKAADVAAEIEAKKAATVANLTALIAMGSANDKVQAGKGSDEDKAASKLAFDTAFDAIANKLLGSVPKVATISAKATGGGNTGAQKEQIVEWYKAHRAAGLDHTAALKAVTDVNGVARGSAWGPVDAYRISIGEKTKA